MEELGQTGSDKKKGATDTSGTTRAARREVMPFEPFAGESPI